MDGRSRTGRVARRWVGVGALAAALAVGAIGLGMHGARAQRKTPPAPGTCAVPLPGLPFVTMTVKPNPTGRGGSVMLGVTL